jgi:hypothetical protein
VQNKVDAPDGFAHRVETPQIAFDDFEILVVDQGLNIFPATSREIVKNSNVLASPQKF